jgi:hypothetical protein
MVGGEEVRKWKRKELRGRNRKIKKWSKNYVIKKGE